MFSANLILLVIVVLGAVFIRPLSKSAYAFITEGYYNHRKKMAEIKKIEAERELLEQKAMNEQLYGKSELIARKKEHDL